MTWHEHDSGPTMALDRRLVDAATYAYEDWLEECARVRNSYRQWSLSAAADQGTRFAAYLSALEAEQRAADAFRDASARVRRVASHRSGSREEQPRHS